MERLRSSVLLIGLVMLMVMSCSILMLSADVREECRNQWRQNGEGKYYGESFKVDDETVEWRQSSTKPYCETETAHSACDDNCRREESAEIGLCAIEDSACLCCGFGLSKCSTEEDGVWELNINYRNEVCFGPSCDVNCYTQIDPPHPGLAGECIDEDCYCCYL